ncbi:hypothetical protein M422DRAFT_174030 [Sphaerobolus stellatus SS14]|uniref:CCAAT-binding factor domain-containing protein n=1 Tax=Sphaerobolus stellatus (strain SS14) TaxID=990650 RepID=A0A0C9VR04_SPHS4|nr:hypothetical protein M422DRAFT_174030 [Sphaerobolus stellatus SS14]
MPSTSPEFLNVKLKHAEALLEQEVKAYSASSAHTTSAGDARFLTRVLQSGTLSDRLSALTLMVQGSPVHNTRALDGLKTMASKKGREESLKALRAIVDWWNGGGAPDRKLKYFRDQPLTHPNVMDQHLIYWCFEDWLKKYFFAILQLLEGLSVDPLPYVRTQAMNLIFQLLRDKPEQEQNLLRLLVNKLNDSEKSVASKASHNLLQLLQLHPQMKRIIVQEVSSFILKPVLSSSTAPSTLASTSATTSATTSKEDRHAHATYYAVITFNQILLSPKDKEVAERLVNVYFELFREILGEKEPEEEAQPTEERDFTPKNRRGHKGKPKDAKKDRKGKGKAQEDVFQEVPDANSKLVSAILTGINRALPYAKSENSVTFDKHIDTLFRITHTATFSISLQALVLIHQVATSRPAIADRFYRSLYASLVDPRLASSAKQAMYLNMLFKALKEDKNLARVAAFVKRFLQVLNLHRPEFICGGLYLLGELFSVAPDVQNMTNAPSEEKENETYDPRKREPQFAHADSSCLWELLPLLHHYHPSVSLHARQLLNHTQVTASADLGINTTSHFLDRFVYRNPKKPRQKGASAMQPAAHDDEPGMVHAGKAALATDVVQPDQFKNKKEGEVPVDQVFFHKFFSKKNDKEQARTDKADKRKKKDGDDDELSIGAQGSDIDEDEVWAAMKKGIPEIPESDVDEDVDESLGELPSDEDEDAASDADSEAEGKEIGGKVDDSDDNGSIGDFMEDEEDLVSTDGENLDRLMVYPSGSEDGSDADEEAGAEEEWGGFGGSEQKSRKRGREKDEGEKPGKRQKKQKLATFASYEDYAAMIENGQEDDI